MYKSNSGYGKNTTSSILPTVAPQPSSSSISRASAAVGDSPGSTLPPGNSHWSGIGWSGRRRVRSTRWRSSRQSAATTNFLGLFIVAVGTGRDYSLPPSERKRMKLYTGKIPTIAQEMIHSLVQANDIEVSDANE